jgi:hypothetical protein
VSYVKFPIVLETNFYYHLVQLGAYLIESPLGRRWSLAGSTFITAFFCVVFALVTSTWAVRLSTIGISLSATVRSLYHHFYVIMTNANADFIGHVGCFVRLDARDFWDSRYTVALDLQRLC